MCNIRQSWISWKEYPLIQLEASKTSITDLFTDHLDETKGFMHQMALKFASKKYKGTGIKFSQVCFIYQQKKW